jgi:CobQ-like glutamine amidotransferase family enzyme
LDAKKLSEDARSYLIKANVEILRAEELLMKVRYDRIRIGGSDHYNPFLIVDRREDRSPSIANSYIDGERVITTQAKELL